MEMLNSTINLIQSSNIFNIILYVSGSFLILCSFVPISLIFCVFYTNRSLLHNSVNMFIVNLIVVDLIKIVLNQPIFTYSIYLLTEYKRTSVESAYFRDLNMVCGMHTFLNVLFEIVQSLSFVAISYERFKIVLTPMLNAAKRLILSKILIAVSWSLSLFLAILIAFIISIYSNFSNFSTERIGCFADIYHSSYTYDSEPSITYFNQSSYLEQQSFANLQNKVLDVFHFCTSVMCIVTSGYFYMQIFLFLRFHEEKMSKHQRQNNQIEPFAAVAANTRTKSIK